MSATDFQVNPNEIARPMPRHLIKEAMDVFSVPSTMYNETSISLYICRQLDRAKIPYIIDHYGNILVTKKDNTVITYPCFCAHLDTVHQYKNGFNLMKSKVKQRVYLHAEDDLGKRVGVGGDDKCGVFACLYLLKVLPNVKVVFFTREESGGIGSSNVELTFFDNCRFLGGIDRWNGHDFINKYSGSHTISKEFKTALTPLMKKYDYQYNSGLFTDSFNVMERKVGISCFNVSCGYYSHHSDQEYVDLSELYNACLLCEEIGKFPSRYLHDIPTVSFSHYNNRNWSAYDDEYKYGKYNKNWYSHDRGWSYTTWEEAKKKLDTLEEQKRKDKETQHVAVRRCASCDIELLTHEFRYCATCKPYYDWPRYGYYD